MYYWIFGLLGLAATGTGPMGQGVDHGASGFGGDHSPAAGPCGADAGPQLRRRMVQLFRAEMAAAGRYRRDRSGGGVAVGAESGAASGGDFGLAPHPLRRHRQYSRPLRLGYVVDMLHFQFWPSYPTFNVADMCIVSGAVLGAVYYVYLYEKHDRRKPNGADDATGNG